MLQVTTLLPVLVYPLWHDTIIVVPLSTGNSVSVFTPVQLSSSLVQPARWNCYCYRLLMTNNQLNFSNLINPIIFPEFESRAKMFTLGELPIGIWGCIFMIIVFCESYVHEIQRPVILATLDVETGGCTGEVIVEYRHFTTVQLQPVSLYSERPYCTRISTRNRHGELNFFVAISNTICGCLFKQNAYSWTVVWSVNESHPQQIFTSKLGVGVHLQRWRLNVKIYVLIQRSRSSPTWTRFIGSSFNIQHLSNNW